MPLIEVSSGAPTIPQGTYPASVVGITEKSLATKYSKPGQEDDFLEWTWLVHLPGGHTEEIRSLTTTATGPKSRVFEYLMALLGKVDIGDGFEESDLVGKQAMLSIIINDDGFSKVDRVVAMPAQAAPAKGPKTPAPVAAADEAEESGDDLPF